MYTSELSHYRAPDVRNVTWFTPQQIDAVRNNLREEEKLHREPVKVRSIAPVRRLATPDEGAETRNILAGARGIVAAAIKSGAAEVHPQPRVPGKIIKEKRTVPAARKRPYGQRLNGKPDRRCGPRSPEQRRRMSIAIKAALQAIKQSNPK